MSHIQDLQDVVMRLHGAEAHHIESVPVVEEFDGQIIWDGVVEVFQLKGHPKTDRVYAWLHEQDVGKRRHVTVLHIPPVVSPQTAVKAAIVQEYKNNA
jgi:hypothetical protein